MKKIILIVSCVLFFFLSLTETLAEVEVFRQAVDVDACLLTKTPRQCGVEVFEGKGRKRIFKVQIEGALDFLRNKCGGVDLEEFFRTSEYYIFEGGRIFALIEEGSGSVTPCISCGPLLEEELDKICGN